jgi:Putative phage tail protein
MPSEFDVSRVTAAGLTCYGIEFDRESFLDSLRKLMLHYQVDAAEIDGQIVFTPQGQNSILTIPEDDLGALDEPGKYEPRLAEILTDERDVPAKVTIKHYDPLKDSLQATQEFKRTLQSYPSTLSTAKVDTNSRQELDIVSPITEFSLPVKQQAYKILWAAVAGRFQYKFKLSYKYLRLDPTDVITVTYKGYSLLMRIIEADFGAGFAREITAVSQDNAAYDASSVVLTSGGTGSGTGTGGTPTPPPTTAPTTYSVSPTYALSEFSPTQVDMAQVTITWSDGRVAKYQTQSFVTVDPGAGNSTLYYITIKDANRVGDLGGSPATAYCSTTPNGAFLGQPGYWFIGTITITHTGVGVVVTSGGSGNISTAIGFYTNGKGGTGYSTQEDLVDYFTMALRATHHLAGSAANTPSNKFYSYVDTSIQAFAFVKATAGWANDILLWDAVSAGSSNPSGIPMIYHLITELDDVDYPLWGDPNSYKKNSTNHGYVRSPGLPICPRFLTIGGPNGRVDFASPNNYQRYTACGLIDTKNKGAFTAITKPPITMNIDTQGSTAGNLGNIQVVVNERYSGARQRERFYLGKHPTNGGLGLVMWDAALLVSGTQTTGDPTWTPNGQYKIFNWSVHNQLVAGGGVASSFGCGWGAGWP